MYNRWLKIVLTGKDFSLLQMFVDVIVVMQVHLRLFA